jgi:epoxyqueuosine reductase QueG
MRKMADNFKQELVQALLHEGAYEVRVCDPRQGFEHGIPGRRPLDLAPDCRSIVIWAIAKAPHVNDTYVGPLRSQPDGQRLGQLPMHKLAPDFALRRTDDYFTLAVELAGDRLLRARGHQVYVLPNHKVQAKMIAYEAGLAVYGRAGFTLHPRLGNRVRYGWLHTNAELEPDPRLEGFDPCAQCWACVNACPAKAHDRSKTYPESFDRPRCEAKRQELDGQGIYCNRCWAICPAGQVKDADLYSVVQPYIYPQRPE